MANGIPAAAPAPSGQAGIPAGPSERERERQEAERRRQQAAMREAEERARTAPPKPTPNTPPPLTDDQQSAYDLLANLFRQYGLPTNSDVLEVIKQGAINGDGADAVQVALQATATWKQRFKGNELRRAAGLNVLTVAEYLAQENQYATIMRAAGVPVGFYDDPSDFADFIGKSISPAEIQDRVSIASDLVGQEDEATSAELAKRGITRGQLIAYALDPERAAPLIKRDMNSIAIGSAATRAGVNVGVATSDRLAARGVDANAAANGFGTVAQVAGGTQRLGQIYGVDYGTEDAVSEVFDNNAAAAAKRQNIASRERGNFGGTASMGVNRSSVAGQY